MEEMMDPTDQVQPSVWSPGMPISLLVEGSYWQ